jgi:hypothetical protein
MMFRDASDSSLNDEPPSLSKSMTGFVNSCKQAPIVPGTTGIIRASNEKLQLEYGYMTDNRAEAIIHTLRASSSNVKEAFLRSNGLSERGAKSLLSALPEDVEKIDLSQNDLGHNAGWCPSLKRLVHLRFLNVSDSQLGDNTCRILCESLVPCRQLKALNLSGNLIHKATVAVAELLHSSTSLEVLDIHWNRIGSDSSCDLIRGLLGNGHFSGRLFDVDLSFNPIGKGGGEEACKLLATLFCENSVLTHLNLSKCDLTAAQCQVLAEGLKQNTTILGIHLAGNEASMNPKGFIIPQPQDKAQQLTPGSPRELTTDSVQVGNIKDDTCLCWVCNEWTETRICYIPGISGPAAWDIWVYTSVDDFQDAIKLTRCDDELVTHLMCPPGTLRYVFQLGTTLMVSRTAPISRDISPAIVLKRVLVPGESEEDGQGKLVSLDVEVHDVNTKVVSPREPDVPVCECSIPRRLGELYTDRPDSSWRVENSLFGPYEEELERRAFCERCFEIDWKTSSIVALIEDDADRIAVRDTLRSHYAEIKVLYGSLCSISQQHVEGGQSALAPGPFTFGVTLNQYTHMLIQHHILGDDLTLVDADAQFLLAATPARGFQHWAPSTHTGGHMVLRHGFFELLVRLALFKFRKDDMLTESRDEPRPKHKAKAAGHALEILFNKHIMYPHPPMKYNFNCVQWRVDVLHTEEVEDVLRRHMKEVVDPLFIAFSKEFPPRRGRFLQLEDWFDLLDAFQVFPCQDKDGIRNAWDRSWVWQISGMSHVDELTEMDHLLMSWSEFLEALARLVGLLTARKRTPSPEEVEKTDYGMGFCSPSYAFCMEGSQISDRDVFAELLDKFLQQPIVKSAIVDRASRGHDK